ncbi:hypothetical protein [Pseudomonas sp. HS6]|uniref:hypothetical protein n=1 Tax=Pseudomonas sp. HS6 TaxID=2850559 RepID=UPI0020192BDC|nr:hypothetical protein [Pseudomonas sp. HS6]UQS16600.1 hypothetical protein JJN09_06980 [Pseudomonas sp. HS6]
MNSIWKTIAAVIPAPAVLWVAKWLGLFSTTFITLPGWQQDTNDLALAMGTFIAVAIALVYNEASPLALRKKAKWLLFLSIFLIYTCLFIHLYLGKGMEPDEVIKWQDIWRITYISAMTAIIATITLGALSIRDDGSKSIWKKILTALVWTIVFIAVLAAVYLIWRHFG